MRVVWAAIQSGTVTLASSWQVRWKEKRKTGLQGCARLMKLVGLRRGLTLSEAGANRLGLGCWHRPS